MSILYKARHLSVNAVETLLRTPAALHAICIAPPREEEPEAMSPAVPAWRCEERSTLKSLGIELDEVGQILTVGKLWDALKHLLTAASGEDKSPDVNVFRGGTSVEYGGDKARVM